MNTLSLFDDIASDAPPTQGIKYAGSKLKLLPHILQLARKVTPRTVLDGFSGTTRVAQAFAQTGVQVIANDISAWSKVFGTCYLLNTHNARYYADMVAHLNALPGKDGWFTENYGGEPEDACSLPQDSLKKPWQKRNTRKLDAIREEIERLAPPPVEKAVLLTSLILALDEVDSTLGHYASYLKDWSPRSYNCLTLRVPRLFTTQGDHQVHQNEIFDLLPNVEADLAYYDPPYGSNNEKMPPSRVRYSAYYHLWTSVCLFDKPLLFGKVKRRADTSDTLRPSIFEEFRQNSDGRFMATEAVERLLLQTNARHILLSYSSGGRATAEELYEAINRTGRLLEVVKVDYKRNVMAGMRWTNQWIREAEEANQEFMFLIEK